MNISTRKDAIFNVLAHYYGDDATGIRSAVNYIDEVKDLRTGLTSMRVVDEGILSHMGVGVTQNPEYENSVVATLKAVRAWDVAHAKSQRVYRTETLTVPELREAILDFDKESDQYTLGEDFAQLLFDGEGDTINVEGLGTPTLLEKTDLNKVHLDDYDLTPITVVFSILEKTYRISGGHDQNDGNSWNRYKDMVEVVPVKKTVIVYEEVAQKS